VDIASVTSNHLDRPLTFKGHIVRIPLSMYNLSFFGQNLAQNGYWQIPPYHNHLHRFSLNHWT